MEYLIIALLLICNVPRQSDCLFHDFVPKLAEPDNVTHQMMAPAPSPFDNAPQSSEPTCDKACHLKDYTLTACLPFLPNAGLEASYVLVLNGGENDVDLNIIVRPANITFNDNVRSRQVKKVNLQSNIGGSSSILLNVGNAECAIEIGGALTPEGFLTPFIATYLLLVAAALFIGGIWACWHFAKRKQRVNGVPYRELEMEQQEEGWDDKWDNEWDVEKPGNDYIGKVSDNGGTLSYIGTAKKGNEWDD